MEDRRADPLDGLDDIPWPDVVDWHGMGETVPAALRQLTTADHARGLRHLDECLEHQGGIVPATVLAVPFLCRLLLSGRCVDPRGVVALLKRILGACRALLDGQRHATQPLGSLDRRAYPLVLPSADTRDMEDVFADYDLPTWALQVEADIAAALDAYQGEVPGG